jgi:subtilisin family serine protease
MRRKIMKTMSKLIISAFIITNILSAFPSMTFAAPRHKAKTVYSDRDKSEIIVVYNDDTKADTLNTNIKGKLKLKKLDIKKKFKKNKINLLEMDKSDDVNKVVDELKKDKSVKYAQINYPVQISAVPTDPQFGKEWGMLNNGQSVYGLTGRSNVDINAVNAWNLTQGSPDVVIGVLDSGVDINHEDLKANIVPGWDFVNNDATVYDDPELDLHGTQVAGIIAASTNSTGITGVAPKVKIMPLKFISGTVGYTSDAIDAIQYAMDHNVKIINCSFGGSDNNQALKDAMANSGILFICAAGNRGADTSKVPVYPASFNLPNIISVAALDSKGVLSNFTSYGTNITVAAPGVNILTTTPGNTYDYLSGTSASAPFVAGEAALLKSYLPSLTITQIEDRIKQNVVPCTNLTGKIATGGRVDAFAALSNTKPVADTYTGAGNDVDTAPPGQDGGDINSWYTQDQLSKITGRLHYGESGVNPGSGSFSFTVNDMSIPAPGFTVNLSRTYNSGDEKSTPFGRGWTFGFEGSAKGSDLVTVILPTGAVERFQQNTDNSYTAVDSRSILVKNADSTYTLTTKDQYTYGFDANGWLNKMTDRNGNTLNITVDSMGKVTKITDTVGRDYNVHYNTNGLIDTITDIQNSQI